MTALGIAICVMGAYPVLDFIPVSALAGAPPRVPPGLPAPMRAPRARLSRRTHAPAVLPVPTPLLTPSGHLSVHTACAQA